MRNTPDHVALRTVLLYAAVAGAWIFFSDELLLKVLGDAKTISQWGSIKGGAFVLVTGLLLYFEIRRHLRRIEKESAVREQAEQDLRESEERFRKAIESLPIPAGITDSKGEILYVNRAFIEQIGYAPGEIPTIRQWCRLAYPDPAVREQSLAQWEKDVEASRQTQTSTPVRTYPVRCKDGKTRKFEITARATGQLLVTAFNDVTVFSDYRDEQEQRRNAERALRYHERLLQEVGEIAKVGGWEYEVASATARRTEQVCQIFGVEPNQQMSLQSVLELFEGDARARLQGAINRAIEDGCAYDLELPLRTRDGTEKWVHTICRPVVEDGRVTKLRGALQDITERKRAQLAAQARERHQAMLVRLSGLILANTDGLESLVERMFELMAADLDADVCLNFRADEQARELLLVKAIGVPEPFRGALAGVTKDKAYCGMVADQAQALIADAGRITTDPEAEFFRQIGVKSYACHPLVRSNGTVQGTFAVASTRKTEFTCAELDFLQTVSHLLSMAWERKEAEFSLQRQEEILQLFVEHAPAALAMFDNEMRYLTASRRWLRDHGLEDADLRGRSHYDVFPECPERWVALHQRALGGEVLESDADHIEQEDGSTQWLRWKMLPWYRSPGAVGGVVIFSEDVSERKSLEAQLRQAQKMEGIGQLAGGVAHDFNNLLTVIQGHCAMLMGETGVQAEQRDSLSQIGEAAERAANLTRQLLTFSRRQTMQLRGLELNELVANITSMLQRILGEDISLQVEFAPGHLHIHADSGMLDQVLVNLAVNSRDSMPNGGRLLIETMSVELDPEQAARIPHARPGSFVCLRISDTGCGITPEHLGRIFEPFFTTKPVGKGTGLGLATTYGIVQQHEGWIAVESRVGVGTTFYLYLPRISLPVPRPALVSPEERLSGSGETILVVEDEPALRTLVRSVLVRHGYRVLETSNGRAALETWKESREEIRLVITDLVMPDGVTGLQLAKTLLNDQPDLPIIYTTGYGPELAEGELELEEGVNFLPKPYGPGKLVRTVRARLQALA